jgi:hypothetical protein
MMYPSYHQKFCISVQEVFGGQRAIQCPVCGQEAEEVCTGYFIISYNTEEAEVRKTFHRGSTVDM